MPRSWNAKRERQYEHITDSLRQHGRSADAAEEIAARTVNKVRAQAGEAAESSRLSRTDLSPSRRGGLRSHRGAGGRTYLQLYEEARARHLRGRSKMSKAELQLADPRAGEKMLTAWAIRLAVDLQELQQRVIGPLGRRDGCRGRQRRKHRAAFAGCSRLAWQADTSAEPGPGQQPCPVVAPLHVPIGICDVARPFNHMLCGTASMTGASRPSARCASASDSSRL